MTEGMLEASVAAGEFGPVIMLTGEADLTCAGQLGALISGQLTGGTRELTIDVTGLRFADSVPIRALVLAVSTLRERGGILVLLRPQPPAVGMLDLIGAGQAIMVRGIGTAAP